MGERTTISWCDHTFNLWWGCEHAISGPGQPGTAPECDNCYAEAMDHRLGGKHWGPGAERRFFGPAYWAKLKKWDAAAGAAGERRRVFVSSMSDVGEIHPDPVIRQRMDDALNSFWWHARYSEHLDYLLLTKRPENFRAVLSWTARRGPPARDESPPWRNIWGGTTCGARSSLWRVEELKRVPLGVRFVSIEPLIEHITVDEWRDALLDPISGKPAIHWMIVGAESGRNARPCHEDWVRSARDAAIMSGVKFHFKQWNDGKRVVHLPMLDGKRWDEAPGRD